MENIKQQLIKLKNNDTTTIVIEQKKYRVEKKNDKLRINHNINSFIKFMLGVISFILSLIILSTLISIIATIIDIYKPFDSANSDGTYTSFSALGFMNMFARKFWYVFLIITYFVSIPIKNYIIHQTMKIKDKKSYNKIRKTIKEINKQYR